MTATTPRGEGGPVIAVPERPGDAADAAADLWRRVTDLVDDLAADDWERPTPCAGWTVRDLVGHLSGAQTGFDGTAPQPAPPPGWVPAEGLGPLDAWTAAAVAARRGWTPAQVRAELDAAATGHEARLRAVDDFAAPADGPLGGTTEHGLFVVRCYDVWVHLQDLREALGLPVDDHDPSPGAMAAYRHVLDLVPWLYAKKARAGEGATMALVLESPADVDTVLEVRDGRAGFHPDADPGACRVEADPAAFTLLASGRGDPDRWRDAGLLRWQGPRGEEFVERARLFG